MPMRNGACCRKIEKSADMPTLFLFMLFWLASDIIIVRFCSLLGLVCAELIVLSADEILREIGLLKEMVKEAILDGEIGNNFEEADKYMRLRAPELGLNAR